MCAHVHADGAAEGEDEAGPDAGDHDPKGCIDEAGSEEFIGDGVDSSECIGLLC